MAIQSIGSAAQPRPPLPERALSGQTSPGSVARPPTGQATVVAQATAVDTPKAVKSAENAPSLEQVNQAVKNINKSLQTLAQDLEFSVDTDSQRTVIKVIDQKTKEVIRQIPSEEALEIAKTLDTVNGLLKKQEA
jgi:flagellar protein FlaG